MESLKDIGDQGDLGMLQITVNKYSKQLRMCVVCHPLLQEGPIMINVQLLSYRPIVRQKWNMDISGLHSRKDMFVTEQAQWRFTRQIWR